MEALSHESIGAVFTAEGACRFRVWAPRARQVRLRLLGEPDRFVPLAAGPNGYFETTLPDIRPGQRYFYRLDDGPDRPDPASRWQPEGVHGPSAVVDPTFAWNDGDWRGRDLREFVIYELHIGTFTPEGTFDSAIGQLDRLRDLGITAVEVMPVSQFPGARNWGYDGAYPFATQNSYGGVAGFQRFVDACHVRGIACLLDVVYNHLGPEGNYVREFGPYFNDLYKTPWGDALNYDGRGSDEVRRFFLASALWWQTVFHLDGLRLDAVPWILDHSPRHFLAELADVTRRQSMRLGRPFHLIGESDVNDIHYLIPEANGGRGLDGQWADDFHHALHALLTGEKNGYYMDYGSPDHLARACRDGFAYTGQFSAYRGRRHGTVVRRQPPEQFVFCIQNHDQVGNRAHGNRLTELTDCEGLKLAAGLLLLSPCVPLLFMGEEYGETAPFLYFTNHSDPDLARAVTEGRRREFAAFVWKSEVPDPQAESSFLESKLRVGQAAQGRGKALSAYYRELLRLRREAPELQRPSFQRQQVLSWEEPAALFIRRWHGAHELVVLAQVSGGSSLSWPIPAGRWTKLLDSADEQWQGTGSGLPAALRSEGAVELRLPERSLAVYRRQPEAEG
jgi:maltooligosyltrehalose trehalohydrolase